jgi:hypothetical protein
MTAMTTTADAEYPVRYSVDYPEEPRNRLSVLLRFFFAIPILVILVLLSGGSRGAAVDDGGARIEGPAVERDRGASGAGAAVAGGGVVLAPTVLMLLFRRKYPRWWFDWNRELSRFSSRVSSYMLLLRDEYPSTDEEQAVHLGGLSRCAAAEPLAAIGEVAPRDPALPRPGAPDLRCVLRGRVRVVRDSHHGTVSSRPI